LAGVTVVRLTGQVAGHEQARWPYHGTPPTPSRRPTEITAVPYFAWANRGLTGMRVWLPREDR
jgi:DUF1680 family protein